MKRIINSSLIWQVLSLVFISLLIVNLAFPSINNYLKGKSFQGFKLVQTVEASEVYPLFTCPCCGQPLNKEDPCCESMTAMIDFIDEQIIFGTNKDKVLLATAKEFGIDRLTNPDDQIALKEKLAKLAPDDAAKINLSESKKDLGEVNQADGEVSIDFTLSNKGQSDLIIDKLSSSCGCTSATIVYEEKEGPRFAMAGHGYENPTDWQVAIKPGNDAILRVYYNPAVHPDLVGAVTRTVSIFSNDPVEFETTATITLEQIP